MWVQGYKAKKSTKVNALEELEKEEGNEIGRRLKKEYEDNKP